MEILDQFIILRQRIFDYFGYVENWRVFPIDDAREYFWHLEGMGPDTVRFADTEEALHDEMGNYYKDKIYTQYNLPQWVYRGKDYTMIVVDTETDGNQFLKIFDNRKERF